MIKTKQAYKVLLFYKYVEIANPEEFTEWQKGICMDLNLKGRILVSDEGLNGTCAGLANDIDEYVKIMEDLEEFSDMEWKVSFADEQVFPRLSVKVRPEIVTLGLKKQSKDVAIENKAHYIEPEELFDLYESGEDFVILDARNDYEAKVGKFKDAMIPPIDNFREFPDFVKKNLEEYKDKNVVTYCTGGIRCEKASAYLREQGFKKVRQLHGGIHRYSDTTGGKHFEGEMFVFDKRLTTPVNHVNPTVLTKCKWCDKEITRLIDCKNHECTERMFTCCEQCEKKHKGFCSETCKNSTNTSSLHI